MKVSPITAKLKIWRFEIRSPGAWEPWHPEVKITDSQRVTTVSWSLDPIPFACWNDTAD